MKTYPLAVTLNAIFHENKILLICRTKEPYKNYWTMPGGKIELGEHIDASAVRECQEETGLQVAFEKVVGITNEVIQEQGKLKSHYVLFVCKLRALTTEYVESAEGKLCWYPLNKLPEHMPAADKEMIKRYLLTDNAITVHKLKTKQDGEEYFVEEFS